MRIDLGPDRRLLAAGYERVLRAVALGGHAEPIVWRSPDGRRVLAEDEALRELEAGTTKKGKN